LNIYRFMQAFYTAALRKALHFQLLMGDFYTYLAVGMRGCAGRHSWRQGKHK